ncbi:MAG: hypothetical protein HZB41_03720, partial [Ignavibacteriae bacterium]|nr:hypothetical protein [Ignavibacteriota bacterium]
MLNNPGTKQRTLIIIFIYLFTALSILAQKPVQDSVSGRQRDTVNFKLKFFSGDTLTYIVKSHDSIIIDFGKPLIKSRTERIKIVCDSINKEGNFFLTQTLIEFSSVESQGETQNIENNSSPWLNRKAGLEIDSVGNRIKCVVFDSINGAMSPGGAFQPYLFFPFNVTQKAVKESWIVTSVDELVENG